MTDNVYLDTSVLAKWYINEEGTEAVTEYIVSVDRAVISTLSLVEMRSLLSRRRRMKEITSKIEQQIYATFLNDIEMGYLIVEEVKTLHFNNAIHLMDAFSEEPLRSLDALHLSVAQQFNLALATADDIMKKVAKKMELGVKFF